MTTITSNGHFLIADKRATINHVPMVGNKKYMEKGHHQSYHNGHVKIFAELKGNYTVNEETVMAYAASGCAKTAERFMRAAKGFEIRDFARAYVDLKAMPGGDEAFTLVCVTNKQKTVKLSLSIWVNGDVISRGYHTTWFEPGEVCVAGSGFSLLRSTINAGAIRADKLKTFHPLGVHMFAAGLDKHSSSDYDAYSTEEDKLVTGLSPEREAVQEAIDLVSSEFRYSLPASTV